MPEQTSANTTSGAGCQPAIPVPDSNPNGSPALRDCATKPVLTPSELIEALRMLRDSYRFDTAGHLVVQQAIAEIENLRNEKTQLEVKVRRQAACATEQAACVTDELSEWLPALMPEDFE